MTGEMSWINQDGEDSNGDEWRTHAAVAKAVGGTLRPFDVYQGPYISLPKGGRLWLGCLDGIEGTFYIDGDDQPFGAFLMEDDIEAATQARELIVGGTRGVR
jgi:hypothetical protein|tara:strand:- start:269 stop:574 length:306 start_codon:yes stop_codon:yes gene_type:complete